MIRILIVDLDFAPMWGGGNHEDWLNFCIFIPAEIRAKEALGDRKNLSHRRLRIRRLSVGSNFVN